TDAIVVLFKAEWMARACVPELSLTPTAAVSPQNNPQVDPPDFAASVDYTKHPSLDMTTICHLPQPDLDPVLGDFLLGQVIGEAIASGWLFVSGTLLTGEPLSGQPVQIQTRTIAGPSGARSISQTIGLPYAYDGSLREIWSRVKFQEGAPVLAVVRP